MKQFLLGCIFALAVYLGWSHLHPEPVSTPTVTQVSNPVAEQARPSPVPNVVVRDVLRASALLTNEARGWNGTLTRRGDSNVFDLHHTNIDNGAVEDRVVTMTVKGREVTAERNDRVHYRGALSADGKQIVGIDWVDGGKETNWNVWIDEKHATQVATLDTPHEFAPEGVFFLLKNKSVAIDSGLKGFPRGTRVEQIEDRGDSVLVQSDAMQFEVQKTDLTNDITLAESISRADRRAQHDLYVNAQVVLATQRKAQEKEWAEQNAQIAADQMHQNAPQSSYLIRQAILAQSNPLDRPAYNQRSIVFRGGYSSLPAVNPSVWGQNVANQNRMENLERAQKAVLTGQISIFNKPENFKVLDPDRMRAEDALRNLQRNGH